MSNFSDSLNILASNVLGGTDVSVSLRKSPIEQRDNSPLSILDGDPYAFSSISYPRDVTYDKQNGHYMLFYINVQNKTKYNMISYDTGAVVNQTAIGADASYTSGKDSQGKDLLQNRIGKGGKGSVLDSDGVSLRKGRKGIANNLENQLQSLYPFV